MACLSTTSIVDDEIDSVDEEEEFDGDKAT